VKTPFLIGRRLRKAIENIDSKLIYNEINRLRVNIQNNPEQWENYFELGIFFQLQGQYKEALAFLKAGENLNDEEPEIWLELAKVYLFVGDFHNSLNYWQKLNGIFTDSPEVLNGLAESYYLTKQFSELIPVYEKILELNPDSTEVLNNLAAIFIQTEKWFSAEPLLTKSIEIQETARNLYNLALVKENLRDYYQAINLYKKAIILEPEFAQAHWNLSLMNLLTENFLDGFQEFEWRFKTSENNFIFPDKPFWQGEYVSGKTLLVKSEQGLGDNIQFFRFHNFLAQTGFWKTIYWETTDSLLELFVSNKKSSLVIPVLYPDDEYSQVN